MAETYCGKSCKECDRLDQGGCPGCQSGPGRKFSGDCNLASCVREKGHETCDTCGFRDSCGKYRNRYREPEDRARRIEEESARYALISQRATVLGKWLWVLFWLVVPSVIGSFLANDYTENYVPGVFGVGEVIQFVCTLVYGGILLKLTAEDERYLAAGVCSLIGCFAGGLASAFADNTALSLLISLPSIVVGLYGEYSEYMAHSTVLADVDSELAQKWDTLWKWYLGLNIGMLCSAFLIIIPILGALAALCFAMGLLVISVLKLVYLYRTARAFREY